MLIDTFKANVNVACNFLQPFTISYLIILDIPKAPKKPGFILTVFQLFRKLWKGMH